MTTTPILGITEVAPSQNSKEVTINDGFIAIENATQNAFAVTFTSNAATLTPTQFTGYICFQTGSATAASTLTVPLTNRLFIVDNSTGSYAITVGGISGATVTVNASSLSFIICDGTNCKAVLAGASSGVTAIIGNTGSVTLAELVTGGVAPLASPTFTGTVAVPTLSGSDNSTAPASTAWVRNYSTSFATINSPTFTGTPALTTAPSATDNSTAIPDTAWVNNRLAAYVQGLNVKEAVRVLAAANVSLTAPGSTIDGITLTSGDRIALTGQTTGSQNGIYIWTGASSTLTLAPDFATSADVTQGTFFWVSEGTTYQATGWVLGTEAPITLGTTSLVFHQMSSGGTTYTFSSGLSTSGSTISVNFGVVAPLASPTFTGTVTVPTPASSTDNTTKAASTAWVQSYVATLGYITSGSAPVTSVIGNTGSITLAELVTGGVAPKASPTFTGAVTMSGATNVYVPTVATSDNSTNAASTAFVSALVNQTFQGVSIKPSAAVATAAALPANTYANGTGGVGATLTMNSVGTLTIDGYAVALNDIVLVKNESSASHNGLYVVSTLGTGSVPAVLTRHTDMNASSLFSGAFCPVMNNGTTNPNTLWLCVTSGTITVGTTSITFDQLNGLADVTANSGITVTGNAVGVDFTVVAPLASPALTGTPTAPTASISTNTTQLATTAFVHSYAAPIASPVFTGTVDLSGAASALVLDPPSSSDNSKHIANTEWVQSYVASLGFVTSGSAPVTSVLSNTGSITLAELVSGGVAPLASPTHTGTVTLPAVVSSGGTVDLTGAAEVKVPTPSNPSDATTKSYVDASVQGLQVKPTATVATTAALPAGTYNNGTSGVGATFTVTATGILTVDGHTTALNDIVLVMNQASAFQNGLYVVTTAGATGVSAVLTRHTDMNIASQFSGALIPVGNVGTTNANSLWIANPSGAVTVGTTNIPFTQLNGATDLLAGNLISISGNTISAVPSLNSGYVVGNATGSTTAGSGVALTSLIDQAIGSVQGEIMQRNASVWAALSPGTNGQVLKTGGGSANASWQNELWNAGSVTVFSNGITVTAGTLVSNFQVGSVVSSIGNGLAISSGTLVAENQGTVTATTTGTINPAGIDSCLVNIGTSACTLTVSPGFVGQKLRLEIKMGATAHAVALDSTCVFGTGVTAYSSGTVAAGRDIIQLFCLDGTHWGVGAIAQGWTI